MSISKRLRELSFAHQLSLAVTIGVLLMALLSSIATSWQGSRQVRGNLVRQGELLAGTLAVQSRLALLFGSRDNVSDAVTAMMRFPDVKGIEIRGADGNLLLGQGAVAVKGGDAAGAAMLAGRPGAFLESEDSESWRFVASVTTGHAPESPFEMGDSRTETIGYVRIAQSKATLIQLMNDVFLVNFLISFCFAFAFLIALRFLTRHIARPLTDLSRSMASAERGESGVRAVPGGPSDIAAMATAFNSMIDVLEERERELRAARDHALHFAQMKADFAATVSHEIRTPLNGVVGALDMLKTTPLPMRQREFADLAWDSSQYLLDLINNILDFSKLEAGKLDLERIGFDLAEQVEEAIDLLAPSAHQKGLDIGYVNIGEAPAQLLGDPRRLRQVLVNLLGNAVKFTGSGEVSVEIRAVTMADDSPGVRIDVIDTGIGIDDAARERIFDSFAQADTSTTRNFGGTGLGLSITRQLIQLMGGEIGLESRMGVGSQFWFTLPGAIAGSAAESGKPQVVPMRRALVVDAGNIVRRFLERELQERGFFVHGVASAAAATEIMRQACEAGQTIEIAFVDAVFAEGGGTPRCVCSDCGLAPPRVVLMHRLGSPPPPIAVEQFCLSKPLRRSRLQRCFTDVPVVEVATPAVHAEKTWRVLVVEDNRTNQTIAVRMLTLLGCRAEVADGGQAALRSFRQSEWDLILMDCNMPEFDGYQTTAAIRAMEAESGKRTPIVAMTANTQPADIDKCLAAGMDDHLPKPLTLASLTARLKRWVSPAMTPPVPASPAEARPAPEPLDPEIFGKLREMLGDSIDEAVRPFLEDMPVYLEEMADAYARNEPELLRRVAHAIKGAAGNLGAVALAGVAREVEERAADRRLDGGGEWMARFDAEYAIVRQALLIEIGAATSERGFSTGDGARVLIVDDDRSTRSTLRVALQRGGFSVEEAGDGEQVLDIVATRIPDVILMDAMMPVMDGFTTCARLQEHPVWREVPVLMITALEDSLSIERAYAAGASDYITKPIHLAVVNQRVRRVVEGHRAARNVRHMAYNDLLTGLPNRILFTDRVSRAIERIRGTTRSLAVLFLDLDRFKYVNDTLGHEVGDHLLVATANRLRTCVRNDDCVARLGGDEFTILIEDLPSRQTAAATAQKVGRALAERFEVEGHDIYVSSSIGITVFPGDGEDVSTLLRHADTAMYRAKKAGSGFQFFESGMEELISAQVRTENALRRALERDELVVYYQPKAVTGSGRIIGMEALLRWRHPQRGLVSPLEFIPLAEETGLIVPIGEWVLRAACRQAKEWIDRGLGDLRVAVNLSGVQLRQAEFAETVAMVITETGLPPRNLILEITESVLMENAHETVSVLQRINERGVGFAIDDFGTGYSSLSYLKRFPVELLKIDHSFIRDVTENADDASIVTGIIALAHSLRLKVVAEGVETEAQRRFLEKLGCDYVQGYLLGHPMPAQDFAASVLVSRDVGIEVR